MNLFKPPAQWTQAERYTRLDDVPAPAYAELQRRVRACEWRQGYHVQPPTGLLNDPNGFCFWRGRFHLFYQWFPLGAAHGLKYWRHLSSPDLLHFDDHGIGIAPDTPADSHGAYSGSALALESELLVAYTGNQRGPDWQRTPNQVLTRFDGSSWSEKRVVVAGPPAGYSEHFRDPKLWRGKGGQFHFVVGAQREDGTGAALVYSSSDAENWALDGELETDLHDFGYMWECPDLFSLDGADVLLLSPQGLPSEGDTRRNVYQSGYVLGTREGLRLTHGDFYELDGGFDFYAPQTCEGPSGERILVGWMGLPDMAYPTDTHGWAHCLTLPRVLELSEGGTRLRQRPWPALERLRGLACEQPTTPRFEVCLRPTGPFALDVRVGGEQRTRLSWDGSHFTFDRRQSGPLPTLTKRGLDAGKGGDVRRVPVPCLEEVRVFSDSSSLEIFLNGGEQVLSGRIFPDPTSLGLRFESGGTLECWELAHLNQEGATI